MSDEYDAYFDDDDLFDEATLESLDRVVAASAAQHAARTTVSAAPAPPSVAPPVPRPYQGIQPQRPGQHNAVAGGRQHIIRAPAQPRPQSPAPNASQKAQGPPVQKKPRLVGPQPRVVAVAGPGTNKYGQKWVSPNPFHHRPSPAPVAAPPAGLTAKPLSAVPNQSAVDEDEDMPHIMLDESGSYVTGPRPALGAQGHDPPPAPDISALDQWAASKGTRSNNPTGAQSSNMGSHSRKDQNAQSDGAMENDQQRALREELEQARKEKAELEAQLAQSLARAKQVETQLLGKTGEVAIVRGRLKTTETMYASKMEEERRIKQAMQDKMDLREKEYRKQLDQLVVQDTFRRQERETSVRPRTSAQWSGSASRLRPSQASSQRPTVKSPSDGRKGRAGSAAPAVPRFGGFKNAFEESSNEPEDRNLSMPPPSAMSHSRSKQNGASTPERPSTRGNVSMRDGHDSRKGKGRMLIEETVAEEDEDAEMDIDGGEADEEWSDEYSMLDSLIAASMHARRDLRSEVVSILLTHRTFLRFENDTVVASSSASTHRSSLSRPFTGHLTGMRATNRDSMPGAGRLLGSSSQTTPARRGPQLTFHALTNLRFPPGVPPEIVSDHETLCSGLFVLLGRRPEAMHADASSTLETYLFIGSLAHSLEEMIRLLDKASMIGPLIAAIGLVSTLILLYPPFAEYYLAGAMMASAAGHAANGPPSSKLMALLARIVRRYGRPAPVETLDSRASAKARAKPRRSRAARPSRTTQLTTTKDSKSTSDLDEPVPVEQGKRVTLLIKVIDTLEGLAWRADQVTEEQFGPLLAADRVFSTLLDPVQPVGITIGTLQVLSLLACRSSLFRQIMAIPFPPEHADVRSCKLPLFNRLASLLARTHGGAKKLRAAGSATSSKTADDTVDATDLARSNRLAADTSARLSRLIIGFPSLLLPQHVDAPVFLLAIASRSSAAESGGQSEGSTLLPELLEALMRDVNSIFSSTAPSDGPRAVRHTRTRLLDATERLAMTVRLLYVLASPYGSTSSRHGAHDSASALGGAGDLSGMTLGRVLQECTYSGLVDRFVVALGTIAFADVPEWAAVNEVEIDEGGYGTELAGPVERVSPRETLVEMAYLAQDLLEDIVSPEEVEEMARCFEDDDDDDNENEAAAEGAEPEVGAIDDAGDTMIVIDDE